jgi:hypothetical protein
MTATDDLPVKILSAAWASGTTYKVNDQRTNDSGKLYLCTKAGTSAGSGGPTDTGSSITDNTVTWKYIAAANGIWTISGVPDPLPTFSTGITVKLKYASGDASASSWAWQSYHANDPETRYAGAGDYAPLAGATFTGPITVGVDDTGYDVKFFGATSGEYCLWDESEGELKLTDNVVLTLGNSDDLRLHHEAGGDNFIISESTAKYRATEFYFQEENDANKTWIHCVPAGSVDLYHDDSKMFETTSTGVQITGRITATANTSTHTLGGKLEVGGPTGTDDGIIKLKTRPFNITANSSGIGGSEATGYTTYNTIIQSGGEDLFVNVDDSTRFIVRGSVSSSQGNQGTEELARFTPGAGVELMYDNSKKLETTTDGITIDGNLIVNGTTTEVNSQTLTVDDKNIELGSVSQQTGQTATLSTGTAVITVTSTTGYLVGAALTKTAGSGAFNASGVTIASVDSATQITASADHQTLGAITFTVGGATDVTANGGGITLKGGSDKTILWTDSTDSWDFNQDIKTSGTVTDSKGNVRNIPASTNSTIVAADAGKHISITAGITIDSATDFAIGDAVTIFNNQGDGEDETITATGITLYLASDATESGDRTLAGRGVATILCVATDTYVITGAGLS